MSLSFSTCGNGHESYTLGTFVAVYPGSNQTQTRGSKHWVHLKFFYPLFILTVLGIYLNHFKHWLLYITYLGIKYFHEIKYSQLLWIICYLEA